jgi:hypothetical protein
MAKKGQKRKSLPTIEEAKAKCQASATALLDNQHAIVLATCNQHLSQDFELAVRVMIMLQNGELEKKTFTRLGAERRFTSQNKMRLVKGEVIHEILGQLNTTWAPFLKEHASKEQLSQLLSLIQNVELGSAVWNKSIDQFITSCLARYELEGKCLHNLWKVADGIGNHGQFKATLEIMGYFKLIRSDDGLTFTKVAHISGKEVPLIGDQQTVAWEIKDNMNFHKTILKSGLNIISIHELFSSSGVVLAAPLHMKEVPSTITRSPQQLGDDDGEEDGEGVAPEGNGLPA